MSKVFAVVLMGFACIGMDCEGAGPAGASLPQSNLNLIIDGQADVIVDPPGPAFDAGSSVQLTANAAPGWVFSHWDGDIQSTDPVITITMDGDRNINAVFLELVLLDGLSSGKGSILVDPVGIPDVTGFLYPVGTEVTLTASAGAGWVFTGWFGDIESADPIIRITLDSETIVFAFFDNLTPASPPPVGAIVVASDGQFLGDIDTNRFNADSLANPFGTYGSTFNTLSIWNSFGTYGNSFSSLSPYNEFTSTPPQILVDGAFDSYLTKNTFLSPRTDPDALAVALGRPEVARN